jgi:aminobenzoyl-glutamate transport protein
MSATNTQARGLFTRFLDTVEWLGNLLPHPVTLFALLATFMVLLSGVFGGLGLAVADLVLVTRA